jgi:AraC family transcriptional regulator
MVAVAPPGLTQLLRRAGPTYRVSWEDRVAEYTGPQRACHLEELELCLIERGAEHARLGGAVIEQEAGSYSLLAPGVEHSSWTGPRPVRELIVHIRAEQMAEVADALGVRRWTDLPQRGFPVFPELRTVLGQLKHELGGHQGPASDLGAQGLITHLALLLLRRHAGAGRVASADRPGPLAGIEERMRAAPAEAYRLADLAAEAGLSRFHFVRAFRARYGTPPHAYLLRLRVERAAALIRETDDSLAAIAYELGFASQSRLTEAFRAVHGVAPSVWRSNFRKATPG